MRLEAGRHRGPSRRAAISRPSAPGARWGTGGSRGIRTSHDYVRRGGAAARLMLLQAAAEHWKVPIAELTVSKGVITHGPSKRTISTARSPRRRPSWTPPDPKSITLKDAHNWTVAGKPTQSARHGREAQRKLVYAIDVKLPNMLCAAHKSCPVFGGQLVSFDAAAVLKRPGVRHVVKVNDAAVAVVADTWWQAKTALDVLPIVWDEGPSAKVSSATIAASLEEGLSATEVYAFRKEGDARRRSPAPPRRSRRPTARRSCRTPRWER